MAATKYMSVPFPSTSFMEQLQSLCVHFVCHRKCEPYSANGNSAGNWISYMKVSFNQHTEKGQNGRHIPDIFKCKSMRFVPKDSIYNNPALFQMLVWHRTGDKPLSEPMAA